MSGIYILLILVLLIIIGIFIYIKKELNKKQIDDEKIINIVNQVLTYSTEQISKQSKQILASEREAIRVDLENKRDMIKTLVEKLKAELDQKESMWLDIDQKRLREFSKLNTQLNEYTKVTEELKQTTQKLASVLSNNQARGAWGEKIIEDLLKANGLHEGIHYLRQSKATHSDVRPDITLLLPNKRKVPVDVKFPYQAMQKWLDAKDSKSRISYLKEFQQDVKKKIIKVSKYISPEENTLDYAILFVPNERLFSFINQKFPDLVDLAIEKHVLLVSPFTFITVALTVRESYRNFMISDRIREIVKYVDDFTKEWIKFNESVQKIGKSLNTALKVYNENVTTRKNQLQRKIDKIESARLGSLAEVENVSKISDQSLKQLKS